MRTKAAYAIRMAFTGWLGMPTTQANNYVAFYFSTGTDQLVGSSA